MVTLRSGFCCARDANPATLVSAMKVIATTERRIMRYRMLFVIVGSDNFSFWGFDILNQEPREGFHVCRVRVRMARAPSGVHIVIFDILGAMRIHPGSTNMLLLTDGY